MSRSKLYALFVCLFLILVLSLYYVNVKKKLLQEKEMLAKFQKNSSILVLLKHKWEGKKEYKKIFLRLKSISKPSKDIKKANVQIFDFTNLSQRKLKDIFMILFHYHLKIKALNITKNKNTISLHVEVKL